MEISSECLQPSTKAKWNLPQERSDDVKSNDTTGSGAPDYKTEGDIKKGFVYKRVPHVTLKSIANNPDLYEGMTRQQIDAAIALHADTETLYDDP
jgi:adenine-specific DNA-methyltransferase